MQIDIILLLYANSRYFWHNNLLYTILEALYKSLKNAPTSKVRSLHPHTESKLQVAQKPKLLNFHFRISLRPIAPPYLQNKPPRSTFVNPLKTLKNSRQIGIHETCPTSPFFAQPVQQQYTFNTAKLTYIHTARERERVSSSVITPAKPRSRIIIQARLRRRRRRCSSAR